MPAKIRQVIGQSDAIDFDTSWDVLASSLREIHTKNASKLSFEELYRNAYKLVLKKKGETLYLRVKEFEEQWLADEVQPRIISVLSPTLLLPSAGSSAIATANEKRAAGDKLLQALKQAWEDHNLCMNMTTDVLMYMVSQSQPHAVSYIHELTVSIYRIVCTAKTSESRRFSRLPWVNFGNMCFGHQ